MGENGPSVCGNIVLTVLLQYSRGLCIRINTPLFCKVAAIKHVACSQAGGCYKYDYQCVHVIFSLLFFFFGNKIYKKTSVFLSEDEGYSPRYHFYCRIIRPLCSHPLPVQMNMFPYNGGPPFWITLRSPKQLSGDNFFGALPSHTSRRLSENAVGKNPVLLIAFTYFL